jgi:hypothetical protein
MVFLTGDEEITGVNQTNKTEDDNAKKWFATSILEYTFTKTQNGKIIKCVAVHEAYPTKSRDTQVVLDIQCKFLLFVLFIFPLPIHVSSIFTNSAHSTYFI